MSHVTTSHRTLDATLDRTLPGRLVLAARRWPDRPALLQKDLGIYVTSTWADYADLVAAVAIALSRRGVGRGDVVAILADNRVEWVVADLAAQAIGAISCGVYPTNAASEVAYVLQHAGAKAVIVEDQEQLDKVLEVRDQLPALRDVIVIDPRGTRGYPVEHVDWRDLVRDGEAARAVDPAHLERALARLEPSDPAVLIYTSGTTAEPKGALWSHDLMVAQADRFVAAARVTSDDTMLSYLPLCHGAEKVTTLLMPLSTGARVHFGEAITTVQADLVEVAPTVFVGMPRIWEKMRAAVEMGLRRGSPLKRRVTSWSLAVGHRLVERQLTGSARRTDRLVRLLIDLAALRALREHLGLQQAWFVLSGGAPIGPELLHWLRAVGIPVVESYGLTEAGVTHLCPLLGRPRIGTVGRALDGVESAIADDGEILLRSATNFLGYLHDPDETARTLTSDGWIRTGDLGEVDDDGFLRVIGRKKQIIITAGGKNLSPAAIENALKASPFIAQAVPVGDGEPFIGALVQIDWDTVGEWAATRRITYTSYEDLTARPEVLELIDTEIARANQQLARVSQVRRFRLLPKQLHQDDGELTATQKVRRDVVIDRYRTLIDDLYGRSRA